MISLISTNFEKPRLLLDILGIYQGDRFVISIIYRKKKSTYINKSIDDVREPCGCVNYGMNHVVVVIGMWYEPCDGGGVEQYEPYGPCDPYDPYVPYGPHGPHGPSVLYNRIIMLIMWTV